MNFKTIFVSGVHGVGKGTICEKISTYFTYPHHSASSLIKSVKNSAVDKNKVVIDADKNQDYLIIALNQLYVDSDYILVDGHFCLQGDNGVIEIPLTTFQEMELAAIILLTDEPEQIHTRLYSRDNTSLGVDVIRTLQNKEKERANYVAKNLNVPLLESKIDKTETLLSWLMTVAS